MKTLYRILLLAFPLICVDLIAAKNVLKQLDELDELKKFDSSSYLTLQANASPEDDEKIYKVKYPVDLVIENNKDSQHGLRFTLDISDDQNMSHIIACKIKAFGRDKIRMSGYFKMPANHNKPFEFLGGSDFDLDVGDPNTDTTVKMVTLQNYEIIELGDGWFQCYIQLDTTRRLSDELLFFILFLDDAKNKDYTGDGGSGIFIADLKVLGGDKF